CSGSTPQQQPASDARTPRDGDSTSTDAPAGLEPGTLNVNWIHGSANCAQNTDPEWQVHAYNPTLHVLRQNKCRTFEAPFVYLLQGTTSAL
ncbi:hypothetical protein NL466_27720, partial [Klebsiella pneumoniae]|nr:hypothetical protein [Klebsiella pneumoniae]